MELPKGWINRQIARLEKEYLTWPDWMKREHGEMEITKTTTYNKYVEQSLLRRDGARGWVTLTATTSDTKRRSETTIKIKYGRDTIFFAVQEGDEISFAAFFEKIAGALRLTLEESKNG